MQTLVSGTNRLLINMFIKEIFVSGSCRRDHHFHGDRGLFQTESPERGRGHSQHHRGIKRQPGKGQISGWEAEEELFQILIPELSYISDIISAGNNKGNIGDDKREEEALLMEELGYKLGQWFWKTYLNHMQYTVVVIHVRTKIQ